MLDPDGVEDGERIEGEVAGLVARPRPIGAAVAAWVDCHDPEAVPGEVRHLAFGDTAVDQAPRRQKHEVAFGIRWAEYLVEDVDVVDRVDGVALSVRIQRAHGPSPSLPAPLAIVGDRSPSRSDPHGSAGVNDRWAWRSGSVPARAWPPGSRSSTKSIGVGAGVVGDVGRRGRCNVQLGQPDQPTCRLKRSLVLELGRDGVVIDRVAALEEGDHGRVHVMTPRMWERHRCLSPMPEPSPGLNLIGSRITVGVVVAVWLIGVKLGLRSGGGWLQVRRSSPVVGGGE